MSERRREAAHLGRVLARHRQREARTAVALLELERRPGYRLLDGGTTTGVTAARWSAARRTRDRLWRDVSRWSRVLAAASARQRRRPSADDVADLRRLLQEADVLGAAVHRPLATLQALAAACETGRASSLAALAPAAERLAGARRAVAGLGLAGGDPDAVAARELTARAAELERAITTDPLGRHLVPLAEPVDALCARLDAIARLRDGWDALPARLDRDLDAVAALRARVVRARARAGAELRDTVPALPPDRGAGLRELRDAVPGATGWRERHDAVVAVAEGTAAARRELDATAALVAQLLERRDDLRGRYGAYRARTRRLGCADDPELTELAARIGTRLWAVPSELARATRDLAAYRRRLAVLGAR